MPDGELEERFDPFLFTNKQKFRPVEIQYQRDAEELCSAERDVGMRERPVRVDDVGLPLAAYLEALEEAVDNIGDSEEL